MSKRDENLLLLHYCCSGNYGQIKKFYDYDPTFSSIFSMTDTEMQKHLRISKARAQKLVALLQTIKIDQLRQSLKKKNICYTTVFQDNYPPRLKEIYDPPWVLYYIGNSSFLTYTPSLSVVGTRHPSEYVQTELNMIISAELCKQIMIVSGLALGIDTMAHEIALNRNGRTIAVLGSGLDYIYPRGNMELFHRLKEEQCIITEYPPFVRPQKWQFPERNRIISGISEATLVVEAKVKSGSLITSELALQQNRDVFAMPGRISNQTSSGTNKLIQDGAKPILSANDILEEYIRFLQ